MNKNDKKEKKLKKKKLELNFIEVMKKGIEENKKIKIAPKDYIISLKNINKIYPNLVQAVYDFNLDIKEGEFIVFVGPSGCGKSTTLRMIAGLEDITTGDLYISNKYANNILPKNRNISMVFQSYALYPNMTVRKNLEFGLKIKHLKKEEINQRVEYAAKVLEIEDYLDRKPSALSGGQRQRVALGRAIVKSTPVFLMDEPLSNLDAKLRVQMRSEIVKIHNSIGATTIYVTHDQTEAMTMASRIVIMEKGRIQQIGTPEEVYSSPKNLFVATFIGSPAMNVTDALYNNKEIIINDNYKIKLDKNRNDKIVDFISSQIDKYQQLIDLNNNKIKEIESLYLYPSLNKKKKKIDKINEKYLKKENILRVNISSLEQAIENGDLDGTVEGKHELEEQLNNILKNKEKEIVFINQKFDSIIKDEMEKIIKDEQLKEIKEAIDKDESILVYKKENDNYLKKLEYYQTAEKDKKLKIKFGIRPEDITPKSCIKEDENISKEYHSKIELIELLGHELFIHFKFNDVNFISKINNGKIKFKRDEEVDFVFDLEKIKIFDSLSKITLI